MIDKINMIKNCPLAGDFGRCLRPRVFFLERFPFRQGGFAETAADGSASRPYQRAKTPAFPTFYLLPLTFYLLLLTSYFLPIPPEPFDLLRFNFIESHPFSFWVLGTDTV